MPPKPAETPNVSKRSSVGRTIEHDVDFQTVFPGWPRNYFLGLLPVTSLGGIYHPEGYPNYACESAAYYVSRRCFKWHSTACFFSFNV